MADLDFGLLAPRDAGAEAEPDQTAQQQPGQTPPQPDGSDAGAEAEAEPDQTPQQTPQQQTHNQAQEWRHEVFVSLDQVYDAQQHANKKPSALGRVTSLLKRGPRHAVFVQARVSQAFPANAVMTREMLRFDGQGSHTETAEDDPSPRFSAPLHVRCPPDHDVAVRCDIVLRSDGGRSYTLGGIVFTLRELLAAPDAALERGIESKFVTSARIRLRHVPAAPMPHPLLPAANTVAHAYDFGDGRVAREEASEVRYSFLVPSLFLQHCVGDANVAAAVWRERYNEERHAQGYFDDAREALAHGRCVVRVAALQAARLPKPPPPPGGGSSSHVPAPPHQLHASPGDVAAQLRASGAVGGTPLAAACAFARVSVRLAGGQEIEVGRTNTEYRTAAPVWGSNRSTGQCPHGKPATAHAVRPPARLLADGATFELYLKPADVAGAEVRVQVVHERFALQSGLKTQALAEYACGLTSFPSPVEAESADDAPEGWEPVDNDDARGAWVSLEPVDGTDEHAEGAPRLRLSVELEAAGVPAPTEDDQDDQVPELKPTQTTQQRPFLRRRSSGHLDLSLPAVARHFPLHWLKPHVLRMQAAAQLLADLSMSYADFASSSANTWKSSAQKADAALQGIPTNLQAQSVRVDGEPRQVVPTVTLGAPAAHAQGFERGLNALLERIQHLEFLVETYDDRQAVLVEAAEGAAPPPPPAAGGPSPQQKLNKLRRAVTNAAKNLQQTVRQAVDLDESEAAVLARATPLELQQRIESCKVDFLARRSVVVSQALAMLTTAFVQHLELADAAAMQQWVDQGFLIQVECLLSTQGKERTMLEDLVVGVEALSGFYLQVVPGDAEHAGDVSLARVGDLRQRDASAESRLEAHEQQALRRLERLRTERLQAARGGVPAEQEEEKEEDDAAMVVQIRVPPDALPHMPAALRDGELVSVVPVVFSQGINEMQSIANIVGDASLQEELNCAALSALNAYYHAFRARADAPGGEGGNAVQQQLWDLQGAVRRERQATKNTGILLAAADLVRSMRGARVTVCKSGKDRTAMSSTLEQARALGLQDELRAANVMRAFGVRLDICAKNTGHYLYSFNAIQRKALPEIYRPPMSTIQTLSQSVARADS